MAIPAILSGISEPLISLADTAFVGRVGTEELAAVGISGSFYLMMVWILSQSLSAISAIVGRKLGANDLGSIQTLIPQAILANMFIGIGCIALTIPFASQIFNFYNASEEILGHCIDYYRIRALGYPFTLGLLMLFGVFRGYQNTSWAMRISLLGAGVNLALDYVLIFGVGDLIPALGVEGAAWASFSAQVIMFTVALWYLVKKTPFGLKLVRKINPAFKWLAGMSFDLIIRTILLNLTFYLAIRYATGYGAASIAAHTIAINIWLFSSFFIDGYALAGNAVAGKLLGADARELVWPLGMKIVKISVGVGAGLGVIYLLAQSFIGQIFTKDIDVLMAFQSIFWIVALSQPLNAVAFGFDGVYKGLAETKFLRNVLIAATLLGFVPTLLILNQFHQNLVVIWIAFAAWMLIRSGGLYIHFFKNYRAAN